MQQYRYILYSIVIFPILWGCNVEPDVLTENNLVFNAKNTPSNKLFVVPKDNKLSEQQLIAFINIKKREVQMLKNQAENSEKSYSEVEASAIMGSGFNVDEYSWVKNKIIETGTRVMLSNFYKENEKVVSLLEKTLYKYENKKLKMNDTEEQRIISNYIKEIKGQLAPLKAKISHYTKHNNAMQHNISLYVKYNEQLDKIF